MIIKDNRTDKDKRETIGYVVGTDSFMSGWGKAPGRSYFAVPFNSSGTQAHAIELNMRARGDMNRVRVVSRSWRPRLAEGDHLSIRAMPRWDDGTLADRTWLSHPDRGGFNTPIEARGMFFGEAS